MSYGHWRTWCGLSMTEKPSSEPPDGHVTQGEQDARPDICGRIRIVLSAVFSVLGHDAIDLGPEPALPLDFGIVEKTERWLKKMFDPPRKSN